MAAITTGGYMNLIEAQKREGYDDAAMVLGEAAKINQILQVLPWMPASHGTYNEVFQASRLGKGAFSKANSAMNIMSSQGGVVSEPVKLYDGESRVDERVLKGVRDPQKVRDSEDALNLEGALQDWVTALFYGAISTNPDSFDGLATRRSTLGAYALGAGGTGSDVTSVYIMELSKRGLYMTYPAGAGAPAFNIEDRGKSLVRTAANDGDMWAWIRHFEIWSGLTIRDDRALLRFANLETSGSTGNFLDKSDVFITLKNKLPQRGMDAVAVCNRTVMAQMENALMAKSNMALSITDVEGFGPVIKWAGIPFILSESIVDTETAIA
jgi:hypothetical protein